MVAIGNELLSGKVRDRNLHYLARELRALGTPLVLALIVPDEIDAIVRALGWARAQADVVLTTGGVGPTHDDVTLEAVAQAFGLGLCPDPGLEGAIRAFYGDRVNDDLLSMARVPQGAELIQPAPFFVPIFRVERVYVFPGDPDALELLFDAWKEALRQPPFHLARLELDCDEGEVAPLLRAVQEGDPALAIGSYPRFDAGAPYRVLVTLEAKDPGRVSAAAAALVAAIETQLGRSALLRIHPASLAKPEAAGRHPTGPDRP